MAETNIEDFKQEVENDLKEYDKSKQPEPDCECGDCENVDEPEVSTLGDGLGFEDAEHLRTTLHELEIGEYEQDVKIASLQDEYNRQREEIRWEIDQLIIPRKKDKEAMNEAGFTRQDDYEKHLRKNDLADAIYEIENKIIPIAESLEKARKEKRDADLTIKDLKRKLDIRLKYAPLMHNTVIVTREFRQNTPEMIIEGK
jgi:hypothetical protein